ncbi:retrovirus-related Pol polyprotein from transposon 17.6 [Trichonephila clavipes]|uniref:Retrovirus-related Pol polyprotein from transposon 17.6 n=1 Tax=Trichonephila clavipes TaxID=2585209 RepID=A0A8X6VYS2_TRICX|nr:retrovirus-related Pol polyprotein from transposon 17.6 [Trichonephila clavipes]
MYVVDHTLPYLILGLPELSKFKLTIDSSRLQIKQNGNIVNKIKINAKMNENIFLHINEETYATSHSQISEDQNVLPQIVIENRYLASGYWHAPINPKDTEKLAFCTNFGLYEWCRLPFEIKGSTNIEADMLSRYPVAHHIQHSSHLLDINEIKTHQKNDNLFAGLNTMRSKMTTQPTSRTRALTSTFAGLQEDPCTNDTLAADQR